VQHPLVVLECTLAEIRILAQVLSPVGKVFGRLLEQVNYREYLTELHIVPDQRGASA
jgi:hypothetical protein